MDNITQDLEKALHECHWTEAFFVAQILQRQMDKNKYNVFFDRKGELTSVGELTAQLFELVFIKGILKV